MTYRSEFLSWRDLESGFNECGVISDHPQQQTDEAAAKKKKIERFQKRINVTLQYFAQQTVPRGNGEQWSLIPGGHIFWQC